MTEVVFYRVDSRLGFLIRFFAKHFVGKPRRAVVLFDDPDQSQEIHRHLWEGPHELFMPCCFAGDLEAEHTPVILALTEQGRFTPDQADVLVNCTSGIPDGFASFQRLVEVVDTGPDAESRARERENHYRERGYKVEHHDLRGRH